MKPLRVLLAWLRGLGRGRQMDLDLRDQISAHLDEATDEYIQQGLSPQEARRAARLRFGSVVHAEEEHRSARGPWPRDLGKDVSYGLRNLRRNPGFAAVAILSLAVGIGANTVIFSLVNSLIFRPRPVSNPEQLVELYCGEQRQPFQSCSYPSFLEFRDRNEVFTGLAANNIWQFNLGASNQVEQVWGEVVSGNYFDVLGVEPHLGRTFLPEEDVAPGRNPVVVISHSLWQRRFQSDPGLIGQAIVLNRQKLTVVGVAPPQYTGMMRGLSSEVWVPAMVLPLVEPTRGQARLEHRGNLWVTLVGRRKPGVTLEQVKARFEVLSREMQAAYPGEWRRKDESTGVERDLVVSVVAESESRIHPGMRMDVYAMVALMVAIVNLVLLIACMNLAGMLLARAVVRRKEIAVRLALGARRLRIVRQLVTESVLLSLIAGAAGFLLTVWLLNLLVAFMPAFPEGIRVAVDLQIDWRVLAYTIAFSTATGILFGLAPALQSSKVDVATVLKDDSGALAGGYRKSRIRGGLVVIQVAFSLLLLVTAGLVLRSLENIRPTRLGFPSDHVVLAPLTLDEASYDRARSQEFYRRVSERMAALPGVQAASLVEGMPGGFMSRSRRSIEIEGYQPGAEESLHIDSILAGPHYFTNMKAPIAQGRDFDERDRPGAPCVAIVNEAFAARYFRETDAALGKHLAKPASERSPRELCEIVGVVRDNQLQALQKEALPLFVLAVYQWHQDRMTLLVHTKGDPAALVPAVRRTLQGIDANLPVNDVQTLLGYFSAMVYPFRLLAIVVGACGVTALLLATIGVYGIVSYSVAQRTREVGIRMALGATNGDVLKTVAAEGMAPVAGGLFIGLLLSVALTRVLTSSLFEFEILFGVSATDSLTFAAVTILLALVALVACYIPARRATKVSPVEALRYE